MNHMDYTVQSYISGIDILKLNTTRSVWIIKPKYSKVSICKFYTLQFFVSIIQLRERLPL